MRLSDGKIVGIIWITVLLCGCVNDSSNIAESLKSYRHSDMTVETVKSWPRYGIKECMVLTGHSLIVGGKDQLDPKAMACADDVEFEYKYRMPHMTVDLDDKAQKDFSESSKWGVPVSCTKTSDTQFECQGITRVEPGK